MCYRPCRRAINIGFGFNGFGGWWGGCTLMDDKTLVDQLVERFCPIRAQVVVIQGTSGLQVHQILAFEVVLLAIRLQPNDVDSIVHSLDVPIAPFVLVVIDNEYFPT